MKNSLIDRIREFFYYCCLGDADLPTGLVFLALRNFDDLSIGSDKILLKPKQSLCGRNLAFFNSRELGCEVDFSDIIDLVLYFLEAASLSVVEAAFLVAFFFGVASMGFHSPSINWNLENISLHIFNSSSSVGLSPLAELFSFWGSI
ncbi:MAG: hypothetical protein ACFBSE_16525 [Prochloraceae cyanobacterium]